MLVVRPMTYEEIDLPPASGLPAIYDAIYRFKDYARDIRYVLNCIRLRQPTARSLLDVACGTGNHIAGLSQDYDVEGLDSSEAMLSLARAKFPSVSFHHESMVGFNLQRSYDVVCCLFRSIAYVKTPDNFKSAVLSMSQHLKPGGLLLIEPFFTRQSYWVGNLTLNELNDPSLKIAWMYVSEREGNVGVMKTHYLVGRPEGVEHFTETHEMGLFDPEDYDSAFREAGLSLEYDPVGPTKIGFYVGRKGLG